VSEDCRPNVVLIVEDDQIIADVVNALLADEGFQVSVLHAVTTDAIRVTVNQLEPDCVLLDGELPTGYGQSWEEAAWLTQRTRQVPVIMFSARPTEINEALEGVTARVQAAGFSGVISKPFDLDELVKTVQRAVGTSITFDPSTAGESERTRVMVERARALGMSDIHASTHREWISFRTEDSTLVQVFYWPRDGVYYVLRYRDSGGVGKHLGRFYDLETAFQMAITIRRP
jgi:CheY-like chemotaxis protein